MSKKQTALTILEEFQVPALSGDLGQVFGEEMDGLSVDFDRVKIPSGGGLAFELPGEDEDDYETAKTLVGVIVDQHPANAWWEEAYSGGNVRPDCSSMDGRTGIVEKTGEKRDCVSCPYNQWGSDLQPDGTFGRGKACKNMRRVYLLQDGEMFPLLLTLPPTSLKNFGNFLAKRVLGKGHRSAEVLTEVSLRKATSGDGINYSQARFRVVGVLPKEKAAEIRAYSKSIKAFTRRLEISEEDYSIGSNDDDIM